MTDIVSAKSKIQLEAVEYKAAVSESSFKKMGSSINWIIDNSAFAVGDIVTSMLTEAQFQSQRTAAWVLMDGASCVGSDYETLTGNATVPDMVTEQRFLRQTDADGNLGVEQSDDNKSHSHTLLSEEGTSGSDHPEDYTQTIFPQYVVAFPTTTATYNQNSPKGNQNIGNTGGESRPKNISVNYFIKVNN